MPVLVAAGYAGLTAFTSSLLAQNVENLTRGRIQPEIEVVAEAAGEGLTVAALTVGTGGVGRLAADLGAGISPGFGTFANRYMSWGLSANNAIFLGRAKGTPHRCP